MVAAAEYTVTGVNLDQFAGRLDNLGPALNAIGAYTERLAKEAIVKGQTIGGKPLTPLAPATVEEKRRLGKARGILRRDGALLASIAFVRTRAAEVQVGTNLEYAPWVVLGTKDGRIPPRNIFEGFEAKVGPFAEAAIASYLNSGKP
jgi:hypothetical protein